MILDCRFLIADLKTISSNLQSAILNLQWETVIMAANSLSSRADAAGMVKCRLKLAGFVFAPSLPVLRGRGAGGEGDSSPREIMNRWHGSPSPLTPALSPRV